jgi:hypothetical protein
LNEESGLLNIMKLLGFWGNERLCPVIWLVEKERENMKNICRAGGAPTKVQTG